MGQLKGYENQVRAIKKLCGQGAHPNIVAVLKWGPLAGSPYYLLDMELCDMNLERYIGSLPHFVKTAPSSVKSSQIWNIMRQIANGRVFIHSHGEVHRDLKPRNGMCF